MYIIQNGFLTHILLMVSIDSNKNKNNKVKS